MVSSLDLVVIGDVASDGSWLVDCVISGVCD